LALGEGCIKSGDFQASLSVKLAEGEAHRVVGSGVDEAFLCGVMYGEECFAEKIVGAECGDQATEGRVGRAIVDEDAGVTEEDGVDFIQPLSETR
jgi:hypothetical protein